MKNDRQSLGGFLERYRENSHAVIEATRNWMVMYDWLDDICDDVVLAHPLKVKAIADAKIKTDKIDATVLAHLLRADLVAGSLGAKREISDFASRYASGCLCAGCDDDEEPDRHGVDRYPERQLNSRSSAICLARPVASNWRRSTSRRSTASRSTVASTSSATSTCGSSSRRNDPGNWPRPMPTSSCEDDPRHRRVLRPADRR